MNAKKWLVSWIGAADLRPSEGDTEHGPGPIATALAGSVRYDRVCLLTNYEYERSARYCKWLEGTLKYKGDQVDLQEIKLISPINYASIYTEVSRHLKDLRLPSEDVDLTFHLSPGTPAMASIWIMLAKTRFPANLIQTSPQHGLESVDFPFDLASDFLPEFLQRSGERINRLAEGPQDKFPHFSKILHRSKSIAGQIQLAQRFAVHDVPVLILGETGTGKELFAEAIRNASDRSNKPFIAVNCGAIPPELANSELFGHLKGAFTGATTNRKGHFQEANGGTLFLDEVGDLPLDTQVRLLRVLQAQEVMPMGASNPVPVNVRVIAATHRDLSKDVSEGKFREDLFHRLAVGVLRLPPLRERDGDVDLLIDKFLEKINADSRGKPEAIDKKFSVDAKNILTSYPWPGNIRELYHTILRAYIWASGAEICKDEVDGALLGTHQNTDNVMSRPFTNDFKLQSLLDDVSRKYITKALTYSGQKKAQAAELLGFANYQTLDNWIKRLGM